ncbi:MAG: hypothetical protein NTW30_03120 [Candidatus Aenigmarchaeota archaeon]|nr:hypothetical protein [Candidatus Aenigmarchaeota archaeon]
MRNKLFALIFSIFLIFFIIQSINAQDLKYNPNCTFYPHIELYNYSIELLGQKEFDSKLIQNTRGTVIFKIQILGNWTNLTSYISPVYTVYCGGEKYQQFGGFGGFVNTFYLNDGNLSTEFTWNSSFLVPEKRFCNAIGDIFAINDTWTQISGCSYCACFIESLSRNSYATHDSYSTMTLQEFLSEKQLEEQKSQGTMNLQIRDLTVALYILALITLFVSKDFTRAIENSRNILGFSIIFIIGFYILIFAPSSNLLLIPKSLSRIINVISGMLVIFASVMVLFKNFLANPKRSKRVRKFYFPYLINLLLVLYFFVGFLFVISMFSLIFSDSFTRFSGILILSYFVCVAALFYLIKDFKNEILENYREFKNLFSKLIIKLYDWILKKLKKKK